jgi:hypothetical protein
MAPDSSLTAAAVLETRRILSILFNQDGRCFVVGDERGFEVFSSDPMTSLRRIVYEDGGIGIAAMLYSTNLLALVGGGVLPKYPNNQVVLFDDISGKITAQMEFRAQVAAVRLRCGLIVVGLRNRVFLYSWEQSPVKLGAFDAHNCQENSLAVSSEREADAVIAFPGFQQGTVQLIQIVAGEEPIRQLGIISSHDSAISSVALSPKGDIVASASAKVSGWWWC